MTDATIVGAGPAGLLTAILLAQTHHIRVTVYDKRFPTSESQSQGRSVNVTLCAHGLAALKKAGLGHQILAMSVPLKGVHWHTTAYSARPFFQPYGSTLPLSGTTPHQLHSIKRNDLTLLLEQTATSLGVHLHFQHTLIHIDPATGTAIFLKGQNNNQVVHVCAPPHGIIIGADGCYSTTRKFCFADSGELSCVATTALPPTSPSPLSVQRTNAGVGCMVERHALGYIEITMPSTSKVDRSTLHVWSRLQRDAFVLGLPCTDGTITLGLYAPERTLCMLTTEQDKYDLLARLFPELAAAVAAAAATAAKDQPTISSSTNNDKNNHYGSLVSVSCKSLVTGKVVLIGDAAHSMLPFCGQGANSALEDALLLSSCLATAATSKGTSSWQQALSMYEEQRLKDVEYIVEQSRKEVQTLLRASSIHSTLANTSSVVASNASNASNASPTSTTTPTSTPPSLFDMVNFTTSPYTALLDNTTKTSNAFDNGASTTNIHVKVGEMVVQHQEMATIEILKTKRSVRAPYNGRVDTIDRDMDDLPVFKIVPTHEINEHQGQQHEEKNNVLQLHETHNDAMPQRAAAVAFSAMAFQQLLRTKHLGRCFLRRLTTDSTMKDALREATHGAAHGTLIMSEKQTAGRGRGNGRTWESQPKGNLYFTVLLRKHGNQRTNPQQHHDSWMTHVHFAVVAAVARACRRAGVDARIKWPNDIWVNNYKISGMLIDVAKVINTNTNHEEDCIMIGIGINVNEHMTDNTQISTVATSLIDILQVQHVARESLLADVMNLLEDHLCESTTEQLRKMYRQYDLTMNQIITVSPRNKEHASSPQAATYDARAIDIDAQGRLVVVKILDNGKTTSEQPYTLSSSLVSIRPFSSSNTLSFPTLRSVIYIYNGPGTSVSSTTMMKNTLLDVCDPSLFDIQYIDADTLCYSTWRKHAGYKCVAGVIFPGGADRYYVQELEAKGGNQNISNYVRVDGGCYVGFCAGAYYGCQRVMFDLDGPLEVNEPRSLAFYQGNGVGPVYQGFEYANENGSRAATVVRTDTKATVVVYYNGGCTFEREEKEQQEEENPNVTITSYYQTDYTKIKKTASIEIKCGQGIAVLCGVHPEFQPHQMIKSENNIVQELSKNENQRVEFMKYLLKPLFENRN